MRRTKSVSDDFYDLTKIPEDDTEFNIVDEKNTKAKCHIDMFKKLPSTGLPNIDI